MVFGPYWEQAILKHIAGQLVMTQYTVYVGACTAPPMTAGGTNLALAECEAKNTANYTRIPIYTAGWTVVTGSTPAYIRNTNPVTFLTATSCSWGTIGYIALFNTSTILTGECLAWAACTNTVVGTGDTLIFGTQSLSVEVS